MFQPAHILKFRNQYPDGLVIVHPECSFEVCKQSDFVGSTWSTLSRRSRKRRRIRAGWLEPN